MVLVRDEQDPPRSFWKPKEKAEIQLKGCLVYKKAMSWHSAHLPVGKAAQRCEILLLATSLAELAVQKLGAGRDMRNHSLQTAIGVTLDSGPLFMAKNGCALCQYGICDTLMLEGPPCDLVKLKISPSAHCEACKSFLFVIIPQKAGPRDLKMTWQDASALEDAAEGKSALSG